MKEVEEEAKCLVPFLVLHKVEVLERNAPALCPTKLVDYIPVKASLNEYKMTRYIRIPRFSSPNRVNKGMNICHWHRLKGLALLTCHCLEPHKR